jgi:uncharacterized protein
MQYQRKSSLDKELARIAPQKELLEVLACPVCKGALTLNGDFEAYGFLLCKSCNQKYPVNAGIPHMLPPQLQSLLEENDRDASLSIKEANIGYGSVYQKDRESHDYRSDMSAHCLVPRGMAYILEHLKGTGPRILETCCATGTTASYLYDAGYRPMCFDISPESISSLLERHPNICQPFIADAENLPLQNRSFDTVIFNGALHHLPNPRYALEESFRILQSGGQVVIVEPNNVGDGMRVMFKALVRPRAAMKDLQHTLDIVSANVKGQDTITRDGIKYQKDGDGRWIKYKEMDQEINMPYLLRIAKSLGFKVADANTWDISLAPYQQLNPRPGHSARKRLRRMDTVLEKLPIVSTWGETMHVLLKKP